MLQFWKSFAVTHLGGIARLVAGVGIFLYSSISVTNGIYHSCHLLESDVDVTLSLFAQGAAPQLAGSGAELSDGIARGPGEWPTPARGNPAPEYSCGFDEGAAGGDRVHGHQFSSVAETNGVGYRLVLKDLPVEGHGSKPRRIRVHTNVSVLGAARTWADTFYVDVDPASPTCAVSLLASREPLPPGRYFLNVTLQGVPGPEDELPGWDHLWSARLNVMDEFTILFPRGEM